jgi:tRNA (mo5U34)-methyltransferase
MDHPPAATLSPPAGAVALWYHTLELPGGVLTPGWFDLRAVVDRLPWPDVAGRRCLDVATYDGFYAFELERRGAAEVIATDIADHSAWDWPAAARARGGAELARLAGEKGRGFEYAARALRSRVTRLERSVYHLDPDAIGTFDVVVCGSLLLHLRDPVRALEAIRRVCRGWLLSVEEVSVRLSALFRGRPMAEMRFDEGLCQWWVANATGHRRLAEIAGFRVTDAYGPYAEPYGPGNPAARARRRRTRLRHRRLDRLEAALGRRPATGVPHHALLARPALDAPPIAV